MSNVLDKEEECRDIVYMKGGHMRKEQTPIEAFVCENDNTRFYKCQHCFHHMCVYCWHRVFVQDHGYPCGFCRKIVFPEE